MKNVADETGLQAGARSQMGQLLRLAYQRYTSIFAPAFKNDLTPTQWSLLVELDELGTCSQNQLGRAISLDVATTKGVVDRLMARELIAARPDPADARRRVLVVTAPGRQLVQARFAMAKAVADDFLAPLGEDERQQLQRLLSRLVI